jgi:hypothetical protein
MPGTAVDGPAIVDSNIQSEEEIAQRISLLNQQGSKVTLGNLLLIPIEQSILYVRPLYVEADSNTPIPELKNVIVAYGADVVMRPTLPEALAALGPEFSDAAADVFEQDTAELEGEPEPVDPEAPTDEGAEPDATAVAELLAQAQILFEEAEQALSDGDLGTYQTKVEEAQDLVLEALQASGSAAGADAAGGSDSVTDQAQPTGEA